MQFFYDGQLRRYIAQTIRMLSGFKTKTADGTEKIVPVMYGDISRQVAHIIRNNSENKIPSAPRISVYISDLQLDKPRLSDATYVNKVNIRERKIDDNTGEYTTEQGANYTVERLMPTPYMLTVKADVWTTNTEQKLQILEQILVLFNPSFEIQTTDNYVDWTSLTTIILDDIVFSNRTIPVGTESDIDVATLTFQTPIWITTPGKLKRLGVIQTVISNIFREDGALDPTFIAGQPASTQYVTPGNYGLLVIDNKIKLVAFAEAVTENKPTDIPAKWGLDTNWYRLLDQYGEFRAGSSRIHLIRVDGPEIVGTIAVDPADETVMLVNWDPDTYPTNTVIGNRGTIDAIIDPTTYNPLGVTAGKRFLILEDIGSVDNVDGVAAWKNSDNSDFIASADDIIEWDGSNWSIVFNASEVTDTVYITNLRTGVQYKWDGDIWSKSFDGEYPAGNWRLVL